jgi:hypothetical protein
MLCHLNVLSVEYFSNRVAGTCQSVTTTTASLLNTLQLSAFPQILSMESPANDYNNTERHQRNSVFTRK